MCVRARVTEHCGRPGLKVVGEAVDNKRENNRDRDPTLDSNDSLRGYLRASYEQSAVVCSIIDIRAVAGRAAEIAAGSRNRRSSETGSPMDPGGLGWGEGRGASNLARNPNKCIFAKRSRSTQSGAALFMSLRVAPSI